MFNLSKVFSLLFLGLFLFSFASATDSNFVDLAITNVIVDGNLYGEDITFIVDYNNIGDANADSNYIVSYDINGIISNYTVSEDLNVGLSAQHNYLWSADAEGSLDINICLIYTGDENALNDCNAFTL